MLINGFPAQTADIGMASAAGLYQSVVSLILVILSNLLARQSIKLNFVLERSRIWQKEN